MFAISFDMAVSELEKHYGHPYNRAYYEIKQVLRKNGFSWIQGSTYMSSSEDMSHVVKAVMD